MFKKIKLSLYLHVVYVLYLLSTNHIYRFVLVTSQILVSPSRYLGSQGMTEFDIQGDWAKIYGICGLSSEAKRL
jgi:hypothetical protein